MKNVTIEISKIIDGGICVAADDGKKVYEHVYKAVKSGNRVILSFYGITRMTTAFLNAAVGQLYGDFSEEVIKERMGQPIHYEQWHLTRLKLVVDRAKLFFKDPTMVETILNTNRGNE